MTKRTSDSAPSRWGAYVSGRFRLAGFGGAALVVRSAIVPGTVTGREGSGLVFDVGLVDPERRVHYLCRGSEPDAVDRLSGYLRAAAADLHPESSLPPFQDEGLGLSVTVESSTEDTVDLLVEVVQDLHADVREVDGLGFRTTRAALASAAIEVRWLDQVSDGGAASGEPVYWDEEE